tara:strand:+ start:290 stop:2536 length:2247 start_codon:yes stop_codon:yes gene_type:complete
MTIQYDPQKVIDWVTPLEKVYARQSQQLERYQEQLRERDRQEREATLDLPEMFSKLASFSTSIKGAIDKRKADKKNKLYNTWNQIERTDQDIKAEKEHFRLQKLGLDKDDIALKKNLELMSPALRDYLTNLSPAEIILTKEFNAKKSLAFLTKEKWNSELSFEQREEVKKLTDEQINNRYKNWIGEKLDPFKLSDGLFASSVSDEIDRLVSTHKTTSSVKTKAAFASKAQLKFGERLETALATGDGYDAVQLVSNRIQTLAGQNQTYMNKAGGLLRLDETEIQQAANIVARDIQAAASVGKITEDQIEKLLNSESLSDHPAGKTLKKAFFNTATENALIQAAKQGASVKFNNWIASNELIATKGMNKFIEGGFTQDEWNKFTLSLKGKVSNETYNRMVGLNIDSNRPEVYKSDSEKLAETAATGNLELLKAEKEGATNLQAKAEAEKEIAFQEYHRKRLNYNERFLDIKVSEGLNLTLKIDEALNWKGVGVRNDVLKFFRKDFITRVKADPTNPNALVESMAAVEAYWDANGGNEKGGSGKFSPTITGSYDNFNTYSELKSDARDESLTTSTPAEVQIYRDKVNSAWNTAKNSPNWKGTSIIERVVNTPESILSVEDIIAAYENNIFSQKAVISARELGITTTQLIDRQTKALINGGDQYKEVVELFDLKNKKIPNAETALQNMIRKTGDRDLMYLFTRIGLPNTTPKQRFRLYNYLENQEASLQKKREDEEKETKVEQRALRYEYMK